MRYVDFRDSYVQDVIRSEVSWALSFFGVLRDPSFEYTIEVITGRAGRGDDFSNVTVNHLNRAHFEFKQPREPYASPRFLRYLILHEVLHVVMAGLDDAVAVSSDEKTATMLEEHMEVIVAKIAWSMISRVFANPDETISGPPPLVA